MARLQPKVSSGEPPVRTHAHRYSLDKPRLLAWFGGAAKFVEHCATFGLPPPFQLESRTARKWGIPITLANVLLMLELAERMHRPLDLYQYLVEYR